MAKQGRGSEQAMIRLPDGMRERIREEAERNGRSMNAEIVARVEASFDQNKDLVGRVAYLEGMNAALGRTVRAFIDHLTQSPEGREAIVKAILKDEFASKIPSEEGL